MKKKHSKYDEDWEEEDDEDWEEEDDDEEDEPASIISAILNGLGLIINPPSHQTNPPKEEEKANQGSKLSGWAIAGIVFGSVALLTVGAVVVIKSSQSAQIK